MAALLGTGSYFAKRGIVQKGGVETPSPQYNSFSNPFSVFIISFFSFLGVAGFPGKVGFKGRAGSDGDPGLAGIKGVMGPKGDVGETGIKVHFSQTHNRIDKVFRASSHFYFCLERGKLNEF